MFLRIIFAVGMLFLSANKAMATEQLHANRTMALIFDGGMSIPFPYFGGSHGADLRYEYAASRYISLIFPVSYRFGIMNYVAETNEFNLVTAGLGAKFYFSQIFWPQQNMAGFFAEVHAGLGYAREKAKKPSEITTDSAHPEGKITAGKTDFNGGATFGLSLQLGYSHVFDFGLILGTSLGMSVRGFTPPIEQLWLVMHPLPEILAQVGWAF